MKKSIHSLYIRKFSLFQRRHETSMNQSAFEFEKSAIEIQGKGFNCVLKKDLRLAQFHK